jgi:hypothetical protein
MSAGLNDRKLSVLSYYGWLLLATPLGGGIKLHLLIFQPASAGLKTKSSGLKPLFSFPKPAEIG